MSVLLYISYLRLISTVLFKELLCYGTYTSFYLRYDKDMISLVSSEDTVYPDNSMQNNVWAIVNGDFFYEWRSPEWKSLLDRLTVSHTTFSQECHEYTNMLKGIIDRSFHHCRHVHSFLTEANAKYWYCDGIFFDCSYTGKLAQS